MGARPSKMTSSDADDGKKNGDFAKSDFLDARVPHNRIGHLYDRIAPVYDIWAGLTETRARNRAIELAQITDGQNILEVAVGTGMAFYGIAKRNPNGTNTGIDISHGMLSRAKQRLKKLPYVNFNLAIGSYSRL